MKIAIVYDRVNKWGGAERVLLHLNKLFPKADLFTSVYDENNASWAKVFPKIKTTFLQRIPFAKSNHEYFSILMPLAFESFNFKNYDLVISVTSEFAKGIKTTPKTKHVSIILTPTRYLWSSEKEYFQNKYLKIISFPILKYLKFWDKISSRRPDKLIAISKEVQKRLKKYYQQDSELIYPAVSKIKKNNKRIKYKNYYLIISRLVSYKKVDVAVKAFNKNKKNLIIIGTGREDKNLKKLSNKNIKFLGNLHDSEIGKFYKFAKALIFPGHEDFGLTPIEAQSFGTPVIAYKKGGALETIIEGKTGVFFDYQIPESIIEAVKQFEKMKFNKNDIRKNANKFSFESFSEKILKAIENA